MALDSQCATLAYMAHVDSRLV